LGWPSRHTCGCHGGAHDRRSHRRRPSVADFLVASAQDDFGRGWADSRHSAASARASGAHAEGRGFERGENAPVTTDVFGIGRNSRGVGDRWGTSKQALLTHRQLF
jgi:hypothetical protein